MMNYFLWSLLLVGLTLSKFCSSTCFLGSAEWIGSSRRQSQTRSFLFGNRGKKKKETTNDPKNEPFVFLIGKPQYNWLTGKKEYSRKERVNWLYKPTPNEKASAKKNKKQEK
jgi:hypothetical protein